MWNYSRVVCSYLLIAMPRIKCFTAQEAVDMILNELDSDSGEVDMVNIPPDDDLSDEDEIDDSQLGEATVIDVPGTVELHIGNDDDEMSREPPRKRSRQDRERLQCGGQRSRCIHAGMKHLMVLRSRVLA